VGGVLSANDALSKLQAGADVVQIYTGLIYKGPALSTRSLARSRAARLRRGLTTAQGRQLGNGQFADRHRAGQARRFDAEEIEQPGHAMQARGHRSGSPPPSLRTVDLGPHTAVARRERAVGQPGPIAAHLRVESVARVRGSTR
jgi:hypothetical protein